VIARRPEEQVRAALPHLSRGQVTKLACAVDRLVDAFRPDRIYVFGSQARGTARPDSDIDVLVIVSDAEEPTYRLAAQAYAAIAPLPLPLEILFMTRAEFDARAPAVASLPATILREGRLLYAA
jgi:predicted nucleotidyltransferase